MTLVKLSWLDRALAVYKLHAQCLKDDSGWTIQQTAVTLNRSIGSISQDLMIARWTFTHENQLRRFKSQRDALEFIREKEFQHRIRVG